MKVPAQPEWSEIPVPGGVEAFSRALDLQVEPVRLIPELARRLLDVRARASTAARLRAYLQQSPAVDGSDLTTVPVPLTPALWSSAVFERTIGPAGLFAEIVSDRDALLLATGLRSLDRQTLAYVAAHRTLLSRLYRRHAITFAAFGASLRIANDRIAVPGGAGDVAKWEQVVGASTSDPATFVDRLYTVDMGRLAYFFDAVEGLSDEQRGRWIGAGAEDLARLYRAFERIVHDWDRTVDPFARLPFDGALLMTEIVPRPGLGAIDAMERLADASPRRRRDVFQELAFLSRTGARTEFARYPALLLTLERMGLATGPAAAAAVQRAHWIDSLGGSRQEQALGLFQSLVAILDRARLRRALSRERAEDLVVSLSRIEPDEEAAYPAAVANWLNTVLLAGADGMWEDNLLRLMAGRTADAGSPTVAWEDRRYVVDLGRSELARLRTVRAHQEGVSLDEVMKSRRYQQLGDALRSLAYAPYLGDATDAGLWNGDLSRRHAFGQILKTGADRRTMRWRVPVEHYGRGAAWHVEGSLLGLDVALARLALRRMTLEPPPSQPTIIDVDKAALALTVALTNPYDLDDAAALRIVEAIRRGRMLAGGAAGEYPLSRLFWVGRPDAQTIAAADAWGGGASTLSGCVCTRLSTRTFRQLTGYSGTGILAADLVELKLQIAERLVEFGLPAVLLRGVLSAATYDYLLHLRPAHPDDWPEHVRGARLVTRERMEDYVSALTARGPLVPVTAR